VKSVSDTMANSAIHEEWVEAYRNEQAERSTHRLLERTFGYVNLPRGAEILDAGCGTGTNSRWLARRGFQVTGVDLSQFALDKAGESAPDVAFRQASLTDLPFADGSFDAILCHGVIMHIPDFEKALDELVRVLRPDGYLVLSEANARSIEMMAFRLYWKRSRRVRVETKAHGIETWSETAEGPLIARKFRIPWLVRDMQRRGVTLRKRLSGELTELYIYFRSPRMRRFFHGLNSLWFKLHGPAGPALGELLVFRKSGPN
jgi:2-polyprenyl-3-methyl-5-hydroxy-6-metoxy-1,4-benzoquinol methylase